MAVNDILKAVDYNTWYTRLNAIRSKHGYSALSYTAIPTNSRGLSSQMQNAKDSIESTRSTVTRIKNTYPSVFTLSDISVESPIKNSTYLTVNNTLAQYDAVCVYDANYSNHTNQSDNDHCSSDDAEVMGCSGGG